MRVRGGPHGRSTSRRFPYEGVENRMRKLTRTHYKVIWTLGPSPKLSGARD